MKRLTFVALACSTLLLTSCGGGNDAGFDKAAKKICDCMAKKQEQADKEAASDTLGLQLDMTDLNYSLCALDIVTEADPFDPKMGEAIEKNCADLKEVHERYVKGAAK